MDAPNEYERQQLKVDAKQGMSAVQKIEAKDRLTEKFNRRVQPGDITEIHEDGWWENVATRTAKSKMPLVFACIKIPGLNVQEARFLMEPETEPTERVIGGITVAEERVLRRCRFQANHGLSEGETATIDVADLDVTDKSKNQKVKKIGRFNI